MSQEVRAEVRGAAGVITLDRPAALNALNQSMCEAIHGALDRFARDEAVGAVVMQGAGERAFCAGGDVVTLYHAGREGSPAWQAFFRAEYAMNHRIATYPKPYIALMDGITMGGGVGISVHAPFRVATERTLWAMPETGIGMIPDVGSTHALPRLPGRLGWWLALTGARLKGGEAVEAGAATHYLPVEALELFVEALTEGEGPDQALSRFAADPGPTRLAGNREAIDRLFAADSVEAVVAALEADGGEWAQAELATIGRMSPTAAKLAWELLRRGAGTDVAGALRNEFRAVSQLAHGHDFFEGVRAQLVDKDRSPRWDPPTLTQISEAAIAEHFREPEGGDLVFGAR